MPLARIEPKGSNEMLAMGISHAPIFMLTSANADSFHFRRGRMECMLSECHVSFSCPWMKAIACINNSLQSQEILPTACRNGIWESSAWAVQEIDVLRHIAVCDAQVLLPYLLLRVQPSPLASNHSGLS